MDLIYTNAFREDIGILQDFTLDLAFGKDENSFELEVDVNQGCLEAKSLIYIEGTEYGGIVDSIAVVTKDNKLTYKGRTFQGILNSKILQPDTGEAYLTVSGEANSVINSLIEKVGLNELFILASENSGLQIESYSFERYTDAYSGIKKMLDTVQGKLLFSYLDGKIILRAVPLVDYSDDEQFDNDLLQFSIEKTLNPINHLICLGKGELSERTVIHLYADESGNISENQTFFDFDEITAVYDYANAESEEKLKSDGIEKLKSYASSGKTNMNFTDRTDKYDVGDIVGTKEIITGVFVKEKINKKIVTIKKGTINIEYKVGE